MSARLAFLLPFALSLTLSLATAGSDVHWQDSGLFLAALHGLGVLYPPGFALYLVLCKAWTLIFFFLDFTLAVHLFSSACAAAAAGTLGLAARDLLRARSAEFRVTDDDPGETASWAGAFAGCLAAAGYTFWFSGLYAKGYSLFYLVLALLLHRMIRAAETGRPRDLTIAAALVGLSWAAHPSATAAGAALLLFAWTRRKGLLGRTVLAAALAMGPSLIVVPILAAREPEILMSDPSTPSDWLRFFLGSRFTGIPGVFGYDPVRADSLRAYFWEEHLGVGLLAIVAGLIRLARANRRLLLGLAAWTVPYTTLTLLFKIEGQHDFWGVAAWMPLVPAAAIGLFEVGRRAGRTAMAAVALAGVAWAIAANGPDLQLRRYRLADQFGRILLEKAAPDSLLVLNNDHSLAVCHYLQIVRGVRPDVTIVVESFLEHREGGRPSSYDRRLLARHPDLREPDYAEARRRHPGEPLAATGAFLRANARAGRPIYVEPPLLPSSLVPEGYEFIPSGALWKLVPKGSEAVRLEDWAFPVDAEEVALRQGRPRSQWVTSRGGALRIQAEAYEARFLERLLQARRELARVYELRGTPEDLRKSRELMESVLRLTP